MLSSVLYQILYFLIEVTKIDITYKYYLLFVSVSITIISETDDKLSI